MTFTVALVGRPNVGKSTLFNRLVGRRTALVDATPGVTRDWRQGEGRIGDLHFTVLDTAGLEEAAAGSLAARMQKQTENAVSRADVVGFMIDVRAGITPLDRHFAVWLRKRGRPILLLANKCEGAMPAEALAEAETLGFGDPIPISAEHGEGLGDLFNALLAYDAEKAGEADQAAGTSAPEAHPIALAVIGRPNVGKSTLVNRLIGEERMLTGPEPGVTRDAVTVDWTWRDRRFRLVDTAGMRRAPKVIDPIERMAVAETRRIINFAEVVVLVLDATVMLEKQDLTIARETLEEGRALIIAANKWDVIEDRAAALRLLRDRLETSLPQAKGIPCVTVSALAGTNLDKLMEAVIAAHEAWNRKLSTSSLNRWLGRLIERHPPPMVAGRRGRIRYMTQIKIRPPTFALFASRGDTLPDDYLRYLGNSLREEFDLPGVPLRFVLRKTHNPYADKET